METAVKNTRFVTAEEFHKIEERVEAKLEYDAGKIVPKEGSDPLPDWVVEELLQEGFDENVLKYEFPMATPSHSHLIYNIQALLIPLVAQDQEVRVYAQSPQVLISLTGKYRIPDATLAPGIQKQIYEKYSLVNPIAIFEVLSYSTGGKDRGQKLHEYLSIESLQEYFLVSQEERMVERYQRAEDGRWNYEIITEGQLNISSVNVALELDKVYSEVL